MGDKYAEELVGLRRAYITPLRAFPFLFRLLAYLWFFLRGQKNSVRQCWRYKRNLTTYEAIQNAIVDAQRSMARN
jgi:hypothetical protein